MPAEEEDAAPTSPAQARPSSNQITQATIKETPDEAAEPKVKGKKLCAENAKQGRRAATLPAARINVDSPPSAFTPGD